MRLPLPIVVHLDLELHQSNVVTELLNSDVDENIYMEVEDPLGVIGVDRNDTICKLIKALCQLEQAPRRSNSNINSFLKHYGISVMEATHVSTGKRTKRCRDHLSVCR